MKRLLLLLFAGVIFAVFLTQCDTQDGDSPAPTPQSDPTEVPTATETALPTNTPVPTATSEPTATPEPQTACLFEDIYDIDIEDASFANVKRLVIRFYLPPDCGADEAVAFATLHAALVVEEDSSIDAIGYFFYCDPEAIGSAANVGIDFAPNGDWVKAGETPKGDYSKHEVALQFANGVPCD